MIAIVHSQLTEPVPALADNNADGLGTYTKALSVWHANADRYVSWWVRNALIGSATSTTFTDTIAGDSGGGLQVFRVTDMGGAGLAAVRQSAGNGNGAAGATPSVVFANAIHPANPVLGAVSNATNPAGITQPSGWTEPQADTGFATPTSGLEVAFRASGETVTTLNWGSTSATAFGVAAVELSVGRRPVDISPSREAAMRAVR